MAIEPPRKPMSSLPLEITIAQIKAQQTGSFCHATLDLARRTVTETGNVVFDFMQESESGRFMIIKGYVTREHLEAHHEADYFKEWSSSVTAMLASPLSVESFETLFSAAGHIAHVDSGD